MSKRPKCEHGNPSIRVEGCPTCADLAMCGCRLLRMVDDITPQDVWSILCAYSRKGEKNTQVAARARRELKARGVTLGGGSGG